MQEIEAASLYSLHRHHTKAFDHVSGDGLFKTLLKIMCPHRLLSFLRKKDLSTKDVKGTDFGLCRLNIRRV